MCRKYGEKLVTFGTEKGLLTKSKAELPSCAIRKGTTKDIMANSFIETIPCTYSEVSLHVEKATVAYHYGEIY